MNRFKLYSEVQLAQNLPDSAFIKGDVATLVDIVEKNGKKGYCLEFFDNHGNTLDVIVVEEEAIQEPFDHAVVHYREYIQS
ncbi:MAG: DUF4926 domain-containing protein [Chitinophagaceae bacterium]